MSLEVHCGVAKDHISGKMHYTSEPGRAACWMHNSLSQSTHNQLGTLLMPVQCVSVWVCVCAPGHLNAPMTISVSGITITMLNHYNPQTKCWYCSGPSPGVMNELLTLRGWLNSISWATWRHIIRSLVQELGHTASLSTNTVVCWEQKPIRKLQSTFLCQYKTFSVSDEAHECASVNSLCSLTCSTDSILKSLILHVCNCSAIDVHQK